MFGPRAALADRIAFLPVPNLSERLAGSASIKIRHYSSMFVGTFGFAIVFSEDRMISDRTPARRTCRQVATRFHGKFSLAFAEAFIVLA